MNAQRKQRNKKSCAILTQSQKGKPVRINVKAHKFWAWAAVISMLMVMITGYKHK